MNEYTPNTEEVRIVHIGTREEFAKPWQANRAAEFDRWLAAHDAEVRAGVVAEEPEWEYGQSQVLTDGTVAFDHPTETLEEAIGRRDISRINYPWPQELGVGRRRKAGRWESITPEGEPS